MPKSQFIDPEQLLKQGEVRFESIKVNAFDYTSSELCSSLDKTAVLNVYKDMALIREFETALACIKEYGEYRGLKYTYNGPIHLCIGEEGAAVGQALALQPDDYIFGSHRSHGELIAKGLRAIRTLSEERLVSIMQSEPLIYKVIKNHTSGDVRSDAVNFLLYGAICEIFAKKTGFQCGIGGSMHAFFAPFGVYPNNAIVGASAPIAAGAALYKKLNGGGIAVANIGDGALGCGVVYEAMNFASMDQYDKLWDKKGGLPVLFNFLDNGYGMGGQTRGETMAYDMLARVGAGVSPTQLYSERINGNNPFAVYEATARQRARLVKGEGAAMLDVVTYRYSGHSQSDKMQYRDQSEINAWKKYDPLSVYKVTVKDTQNAPSEQWYSDVDKLCKDAVYRVCEWCFDDKISPFFEDSEIAARLKGYAFSDKKRISFGNGAPQVNAPKVQNARYARLQNTARFGLDSSGRPLDPKQTVTLKDAVFEAILDKYYEDSSLISYGEDVRDWGGVCFVYKGLTESIPYHRLFNAPISEGAIVSSAVGYAMSGGRVVIEIMFADFMLRAADEIFNQLAKWQAMSAGKLSLPVVLRVSIGSKYGTQHSQDLTALAAHIPGLKVVCPATPYDAKGLMNAALSGCDPVVFFEAQKLYNKGEQFVITGVPKGYYEVEIGKADIKRIGTDVTILSIGSALYTAIEAAESLAEHGVQAEVIDARSIAPFDYDTVAKSLAKTGRLTILSEACGDGSVASELCAKLTERCFASLKCAPTIIASPHTVVPPSVYEKGYYPQADEVCERVLKMMG